MSNHFPQPFFVVLSFRYALCCVLFILTNALPAETLSVDREKLADVQDNTPLARAADKLSWDYLFGFLREHSESQLNALLFGTAGYTDLDRQPDEYRGKMVKITGELIRCEKQQGFYESWILVKDKKDVPIAVCSLEVPAGLPHGSSLNEEVSVTGVFYKRRLFLTSENEECTAPTLLAKTLSWKPKPKSPLPSSQNVVPNQWTLPNTVLSLVLLAAVWLFVRSFVNKPHRKISFNAGHGEGVIIPQVLKKPEK